MGPYEIEMVFENGSVWIKTIDEEQLSFLVNSHELKFYHKPMSKDELIADVLQKNETEVVSEDGNLPTPTPSSIFLNIKIIIIIIKIKK